MGGGQRAEGWQEARRDRWMVKGEYGWTPRGLVTRVENEVEAEEERRWRRRQEWNRMEEEKIWHGLSVEVFIMAPFPGTAIPALGPAEKRNIVLAGPLFSRNSASEPKDCCSVLRVPLKLKFFVVGCEMCSIAPIRESVLTHETPDQCLVILKEWLFIETVPRTFLPFTVQYISIDRRTSEYVRYSKDKIPHKYTSTYLFPVEQCAALHPHRIPPDYLLLASAFTPSVNEVLHFASLFQISSSTAAIYLLACFQYQKNCKLHKQRYCNSLKTNSLVIGMQMEIIQKNKFVQNTYSLILSLFQNHDITRVLLPYEMITAVKWCNTQNKMQQKLSVICPILADRCGSGCGAKGMRLPPGGWVNAGERWAEVVGRRWRRARHSMTCHVPTSSFARSPSFTSYTLSVALVLSLALALALALVIAVAVALALTLTRVQARTTTCG
ncbi:hypothetical protein WN51_09957 [Melipona quadrifasciata]|uniref:Uncharacterized protein n=1 Tax=Melipona quadrifasciata TaxID=166423 RepID=A0A0N1IU79_9HYME|nr:hypothetical protein WN51_09957 [Melipona quadrifasciata]